MIKYLLFFALIIATQINCIDLEQAESSLLQDIENKNTKQKIQLNFDEEEEEEQEEVSINQQDGENSQQQQEQIDTEQVEDEKENNTEEEQQQQNNEQQIQQVQLQQQQKQQNYTATLEPGQPVQFNIKNQGKKYKDFLFPINSTDSFNILLQTAEKQEISTIQVQLHSHINETLFNQYQQVKWTTHGEEKSLENERAHSITINTQQVECGPGCVYSIRCFGIGSLNLTAYYNDVFLQTNQSFIQNLEMGEQMVYHILDSQEFFMYVEFFSAQSNIQLKIFRDNVTQIINQKLSTPFEYYIKPGNTLVQSSSKHFYDIKVTALQESEIMIGTFDRNKYFSLFQQEQSEIDHWEEEEFAIIIFAIILLFLAFCINKYMTDYHTAKKSKRYRKLKNNFGNSSNYPDTDSEQISLI